MSNIENQKTAISADARILALTDESPKNLLKMIQENTKNTQLGAGRIYLFWIKALLQSFLGFRGVGYILGGIFAFWVPAIAVMMLDLNIFVCLSVVALFSGWYLWKTMKDILAVLAEQSEQLLATGEEANQPSQP